MQPSPAKVIHDAAYMRDFIGSQTRDIYNDYLEMMGDDHIGWIINGFNEPVEKIRYWQGVLAGLRLAKDLPEKVIALAKETQKEKTNA